MKEDREDIVGVNDIAEEFIRVFGYSHIKPTLFEYASLTQGGIGDRMKFSNLVKDTLSACGLSESVTYSFTSPKFVSQLKLEQNDPARNAIKLVNPLGEALSVMRTTLTHSMIETLVYNATHFNKAAKLFEIANVYLPKSLPLEELPDEEQRLCIGMYGEDVDFFTLKGALERTFGALHLDVKYVRSNRPYLHPGRNAEVLVSGNSIGFLGEIHPDVADNYGMDARVYVAEISLDKIFDVRLLDKKKYVAFSKFPNIERDLAVVVNEDVLAGDMISAVKDAKSSTFAMRKCLTPTRANKSAKAKERCYEFLVLILGAHAHR